MKQNYRFIFMLILVLGCTLSAFGAVAAPKKRSAGVLDGDEEDRVVKKKCPYACGCSSPIRVAGFVTNPPFGWVDVFPMGAGAPDRLENAGLGFEVFKKVAEKNEWRYTNVGYTSYQKAVNALKRGEVDLLLNAYTPRSLGTGTTPVYPSYFKNSFIVFFAKGKERPVASLEDLANLKGIARNEERVYQFLYQVLPEGVSVRPVNSARTAFRQVLSGEADYLISSPYAAEAEIRRYKLQDKFARTNVSLRDADLFFVLSTNSPCLRIKADLEKTLTEMNYNRETLDGFVRRLIDDWGERFRFQAPLEIKVAPNEAPVPQPDESANVDDADGDDLSNNPV